MSRSCIFVLQVSLQSPSWIGNRTSEWTEAKLEHFPGGGDKLDWISTRAYRDKDKREKMICKRRPDAMSIATGSHVLPWGQREGQGKT